MKSILAETTGAGRLNFKNLCLEFLDMDEAEFMEVLKKECTYIETRNDSLRSEYMKKLEDKWYASLESEPDYSVYSEINYNVNAFICWGYFSRKYLLQLKKADFFEDIKYIADLGCGIGYTSAAFKEVFPGAEVIATQLKNSVQYNIASKLGNDYGFTIVEDIKDAEKSFDIVFASEYFEHFERPIEHLEHVLKSATPRYIIFANAFNTVAIGHFIKYKHNEEIIDQKEISRKFLKALKGFGYEKVQTGFWNNRPAVYKRIN